MAEINGSSRLSVANWRRNELLRRRTTNSLVAAWQRNYTSGRAVELTVDAVLQMQRQIVAGTDAYISASAAVATGTPSTPVGLNAERLIGVQARRGRFLEDVYSPVQARMRSDGFDAGLALLRQQIATDGQLAHQRALQARNVADRRVVGFKRQINPVAGGQTCGLCIAASTQRYSKQALLPLHPMCRCSVVPIYSTDPLPESGPFDRDALEAVYARTDGATDIKSLSDARFNYDDLPPTIDSDAIRALEPRVAMHPEYGAYLTGNNHASVFDLP